MNTRDPKLTVLQFNEYINNQDADELGKLLSEGTKLVEGEETTKTGKAEVENYWIEFFKLVPDYRNHFTRIESEGDRVIIIGFSTCSNELLDGPALWTASVKDDLIDEWRILEDTRENRASLGIN